MSEKAKKLVEVEDQKSFLDEQEKSDMLNFLRNTANIPDIFLEKCKEDNNLLKLFYKSEYDKWTNSQVCKKADEAEKHEKAFQGNAKSFLEQNKDLIDNFVVSTIGNKQSQVIRYSEKLADNRRLDVIVHALRKVPLETEQILAPQKFLESLKEKFIDKFSIKKTVDLITMRKRSISALGKDEQIETDDYRLNMQYVLRERTKKEKSEDEKAEKKAKK